MEIVRYMTFAGLLFLIGLYGALTRRSFAGVLLSLSVSTAGLVLAFVTFNRLIQPAETHGYLFGLIVLMMSIVYGVFAAQFVRQGRPKRPVSTAGEKPLAFDDSFADNSSDSSNDSSNENCNNVPAQNTVGRSRVRFSRRESEGFAGLVTFSNSFAFQVSVIVMFVVGYLLMRLSVVSALAFLGGVGALTHMLHRRKEASSEKKRKKNPAANAFSVAPTRTDKV